MVSTSPKVLLIFFLIPFSTQAQTANPHSLHRTQDSLAKIHLLAVKTFIGVSQPIKAFAELLKADGLYKKSGNKTAQAIVNTQLGAFFEKNQLWEDAERYYETAYMLTADPDSSGLSADISLKLAESLFWQEKYQSALKYYQIALDYFEKKRLKNRMAESYVQIARIKDHQKNYKQAESLILNQALPLFRAADNEFGRISCFDVLGRLYHKQKKYSQAKWFFIQANTAARKVKNTEGIITSLVELSKVKADINDFDLALRDLKEAQFLAKKNETLSLLADLNEAFAIVYNKSGNKSASSNYWRAYESLDDSMDVVQNNRVIAARQAAKESKYLFNEAQKTTTKIIKKQENSSLKYYLIAFIALVIILGIGIYIDEKNSKGSN